MTTGYVQGRAASACRFWMPHWCNRAHRCSSHEWYQPEHSLWLQCELDLREKHETMLVSWKNTSMNSDSNQCDHVPGKQAGAKKAFLGLRAWSFQKLVTSCMMKLQLSVSYFRPSFPSSPTSEKIKTAFIRRHIKWLQDEHLRGSMNVPMSDWGSLDSVKCTRLFGLMIAMERAVITSLWNTSGSSSFPSLLQVFRHCTALLSRDWS